jgi:hypothetical protein
VDEAFKAEEGPDEMAVVVVQEGRIVHRNDGVLLQRAVMMEGKIYMCHITLVCHRLLFIITHN